MLEKAKKFQEEGTRSFYSLVFDKLKLLVHELDMRFPNMRRNTEYNKILQELYSLITDYKDKFIPENYINSPINSSNDSMRLLLNKMQEYKAPKKEVKEVKVNTNNISDTTKYTNFYKRNSFVFKPKETSQNKSTNMDKVINERILPNETKYPKSESGFSFEEALHPKVGLEEIMKAFDFYNENKKNNQSGQN